MSVPRPAMIVLAPIVPAPTGNGLAMRVHQLVQAAAVLHDVHVFVLAVSGTQAQALPAAAMPGVTVRHIPLTDPGDRQPMVQLMRHHVWRERLAALQPLPAEVVLAAPSLAGDIVDLVADAPLVSVLACRLALAPLGLAVSELADIALLIDADDDDAAFFAESGDEERAAQWDRLGRVCLPEARLVTTASEADRRWLAERHALGTTARIVNAVPIPEPSRCGTPPGEGRLLFVGNLIYAPNVEGVTWFIDEVMPQLPERLSIDLVGQAHPDLLRLGGPRVRFQGWVADVAPWYRQADAVVVPLQAGSGTRIKVLEAFAFRRPVVSTTKGIDGIAAHDGVHLRVAESADEFAAAVMDADGGAAHIDAAWELVSSTYDAAGVRAATSRLFAST